MSTSNHIHPLSPSTSRAGPSSLTSPSFPQIPDPLISSSHPSSSNPHSVGNMASTSYPAFPQSSSTANNHLLPTSSTADTLQPQPLQPHNHIPNLTPQSYNHIPNLNPSTTFDRYASPAASYPSGPTHDWDQAYADQLAKRRLEKIERDKRGWRGGNGTARSGYSREAVPVDSYFGEEVTGVIGRHLPKEIVRIERDWSGGEVAQFETGFPLELEGRISPAQWKTFIHTINDHLVTAYSVRGAVVDNLIAIATWWTSLLWRVSHFERGLRSVEAEIARNNKELFNPKGLNILSPRGFALQFMEIEYY